MEMVLDDGAGLTRRWDVIIYLDWRPRIFPRHYRIPIQNLRCFRDVGVSVRPAYTGHICYC